MCHINGAEWRHMLYNALFEALVPTVSVLYPNSDPDPDTTITNRSLSCFAKLLQITFGSVYMWHGRPTPAAGHEWVENHCSNPRDIACRLSVSTWVVANNIQCDTAAWWTVSCMVIPYPHACSPKSFSALCCVYSTQGHCSYPCLKLGARKRACREIISYYVINFWPILPLPSVITTVLYVCVPYKRSWVTSP